MNQAPFLMTALPSILFSPIDEDGDPEESTTPVSHQRPTTIGRRVLIVEDNFLVSTDFEASLVEAGYDVVGIAVSRDEAVRACEMSLPDIALVDVRLLGDLDGIDVAIEIYHRFQIRAIFVTANADDHSRARARSAQPLGWITKPVSGKSLISRLDTLRGLLS